MSKGNYVDGFVMCIPKKNGNAYKKMAKEGCDIWMKFGALDYKECRLDDVAAKDTGITFPKMAKTKPSETVWFSFIVFKSRQHRDAVNKKVMAYFGEKYGNVQEPMPFDMKRFARAGFKVEISA